VRLYREFARANLVSPKRIIVAAKLLHACRYLHDADQSIEVVAGKVGYGQASILVLHSLQVLGVTPSAIRSELGKMTFHRRMAAWLKPPERHAQTAKLNLPRRRRPATNKRPSIKR